MKLTAGVAYRVTSSRYAASEPARASRASSASLRCTATHYTAVGPGGFQCGGRFVVRGSWFVAIPPTSRLVQFARRWRDQAFGVIRRFIRNREPVEIALGIDSGHAAGPCSGNGLTIDVVLNVAGREHPRTAGLRTVMCHDVASFVQLELAAEERGVRC